MRRQQDWSLLDDQNQSSGWVDCPPARLINMADVLKIFAVLVFLSANVYAGVWTSPLKVQPDGWQAASLRTLGLSCDASNRLWFTWGGSDTFNSPSTRGIYINSYSVKDKIWSTPVLVFPEDETNIPFWTSSDHFGCPWVFAVNFPNLGGASVRYYDGHELSPTMVFPKPPTPTFGGAATGDSVGNLWVVSVTDYKSYWHWIYSTSWNGDTWAEPERVSPIIDGEAYGETMTTTKNGTVWVAWISLMATFPDSSGIFCQYRTSTGWSDTFRIRTLRNFTNCISLTPDHADGLWAVWFEGDIGDTFNIYVNHYTGKSWSAPTLIAVSLPGNYYPHPMIVVDGHERVWVAWEGIDSSHVQDVYFCYFDGNSWSIPAQIDATPNDDQPVLATDKNGTVWAAWSTRDGNYPSVYTCHTTGLAVVEGLNRNALSPAFQLARYPNPFNSSTTIRFSLTNTGYSKLNIYNSIGERIRTLIDGRLSAGSHSVIWNGKDDQKHLLPNGIYFCRLETKGYTAVRQIVLLK